MANSEKTSGVIEILSESIDEYTIELYLKTVVAKLRIYEEIPKLEKNENDDFWMSEVTLLEEILS